MIRAADVVFIHCARVACNAGREVGFGQRVLTIAVMVADEDACVHERCSHVTLTSRRTVVTDATVVVPQHRRKMKQPKRITVHLI